MLTRIRDQEGTDVTDDVTDDRITDTAHESADTTRAADADDRPPQYGVGPFSVREAALVAVWLLAFIVSFFSLSNLRFDSVWTSGLLWILTIGVPSVAVFLIVLRRLSPDGIRRVGSLGIDQFASVAFTVSAVLWLQMIWETVAFVVQDGPWVRSWVMWVEFFLMLAGVVLTVFAPILPVLGEDFRDRREIPAHRNARPVRPVVARPKPEPRPAREPVADEQAPSPYADAYSTGPVTGLDAGTPSHARAYDTRAHDTGAYDAGSYDAGSYDAGSYDTGSFEPDRTESSAGSATAAVAWEPEASGTGRTEPADTGVREQAPAVSQPIGQQPFWALAATERDVYDAHGSPLFRIGPTAWALVIEDRGSVFVVRHEDGRIGYLHDVSGITRG